jgi:hypothetical protein
MGRGVSRTTLGHRTQLSSPITHDQLKMFQDIIGSAGIILQNNSPQYLGVV